MARTRFGNAEKYKLVQAAFAHYGTEFSDIEIARHCDDMVTSTLVAKVRKQIEADQLAVGVQPAQKRLVKRGNTWYLMNFKNIGRSPKNSASKNNSVTADARVANILKEDFGREI